MFAALASIALAASPAAPDRLNALAFDNGAFLVEDGGSYQNASGIDGWSPWHLTDGDETQGWCSPEGKPTGTAFTWELDTTWTLAALGLSTRNLQEGGYPGISAKSVDLFAGDGKALRKIGSFAIGREQRKEFPLPRGTTARRVRVVVTANHGHAELTELSEIELFGAREGKATPPPFKGDFTTNYGPIRVATEGETVLGCYDWTEGATLEGVLDGRVARVTWTEPREDVTRFGTATFALSPDGRSLWGVWYENGSLKGDWAGSRADAGEGPKCTPRRRSQLEVLRKQKRLVLYGIRFDSNADVPRPESEATIAEVQALLVQDPKLRLQVEGHTDSTNTDAFNLDLSQRRAQRVVAALVKRGADAKRLEAKGFGRTRPVADNATAQGRALNRRVEVSIAGP